MQGGTNALAGCDAFSVSESSSGNQFPAASRRSAMGGLLKRRETWTLSAQGWVLMLALVTALATTFLFGIHPFLAVTDRVPARILVVEGWIPDYALKRSLEEFRTGRYEQLLTTGGPYYKSGFDVDKDDTLAWIAAVRLKRLGGDRDLIWAVPSPLVERDRTYAAAVALKKWFELNRVSTKSINIVTLGAHARRTRVVYQKALGKDFAVGVIAVPDQEYNPERWWRYSEGVREVVSETTAYVYARFIFRPAQ